MVASKVKTLPSLGCLTLKKAPSLWNRWQIRLFNKVKIMWRCWLLLDLLPVRLFDPFGATFSILWSAFSLEKYRGKQSKKYNAWIKRYSNQKSLWVLIGILKQMIILTRFWVKFKSSRTCQQDVSKLYGWNATHSFHLCPNLFRMWTSEHY